MTIEERSRIWAEKQVQDHHDYPSMSDRVRKGWTKSYMQDYMSIATAQKDVDMKRICKLEEAVKAFRAFCYNIINGIYIDNEIAAVEQLRYIETNYSNDVDWDSIEK